MATQNPFTDNPPSAEVWELGYIDGFAEPETDHFLPFSPDILQIFQLGELAGRDDRRLQPTKNPADGEDPKEWGVMEVAEPFLIHALGMAAEHIGLKVGGLISLVIEVLMIPGDVQLIPLEPEWEGAVDQGGETYAAVCGLTNHEVQMFGTTTDDGYWVGPERQTFKEAAADRKVHQHPETIVVRCSQPDGACGPVWPLK